MNIDSAGVVVLMSRLLRCHMRGLSIRAWAFNGHLDGLYCAVKRGGDSSSCVVQFTSSAVALGTVEVVSALVGPHTTVD